MSDFKISEFSKLTGLSIKALRLYEQHGILTPRRSSFNKYRIYEVEHIEQAKKIAGLRSSGFSLKEIKALFSIKDKNSKDCILLLHQQIIKTGRTIAMLEEQRNQLKKQIDTSCDNYAFATPPICQKLNRLIKSLTEKEILSRTKKLSNKDYLKTLSMVDDVSKAKLLSVVSNQALKSLKADIKKQDQEYLRLWT